MAKPTRTRETRPYDVLQVRRYDWPARASRDPWAAKDGWEDLSTLRTPEEIRLSELAVETGYVGCVGNGEFRIKGSGCCADPVYFNETPLPAPVNPRGPVYL